MRKTSLNKHVYRTSSRHGGVSVSLVLAWPFYVLLSAIVLEIAMLGMNYLSLTSAVDRVSSQLLQWLPHRDALALKGRSLEYQIQREVSKTMLPYVITRDQPTGDRGDARPMGQQFAESGFGVPRANHFNNRWNRIMNAIRIRVEEATPAKDFKKITIHVSYESPFWIPWIGRMLGTKSKTGANHYVWELKQSTQVTLLVDQWKRTNIGIEYSPHLSKKR
jgi:hypothetical protein